MICEGDDLTRLFKAGGTESQLTALKTCRRWWLNFPIEISVETSATSVVT
jgi:hypothetical protein